MRIIILGDIGASKSNLTEFCNADLRLFSKEIVNRCNNADIVLLNLEKPLSDVYTPLGKCPPDYIAPTDSINGILMLRPTAVTLANNHILDQGEAGLNSTVETLEKHHIQYVGTGKNTVEAKRPLIIERKGIKVGIYACCEKEFSFATDNSPGANAFDPLNSIDDIVSLKTECDFLIVLFHGGMQDFPYPMPYQRKVCKKMCDKGADLVICQHSHTIGCEEWRNDSCIVYGQGNFLLDEKNDPNWHNGLMVEVIMDQNKWEIKYIPTLVENHCVGTNINADHILSQFYERSEVIKNESKYMDLYLQMCRSKLPSYLIKLSGKRSLTQRIIRRLGLEEIYSRYLYDAMGLKRFLDYLYCDSHREAIESGLEERI